MPDVAGRTTVVNAQVIRIGGNRADAVGIAVRFRQNVVRVHRGIAMETAVEVNDELVLVVTPTRVVFEDVATRRGIDVRRNKIRAVQRPDTTVDYTRNKRAGQRRVNRSGAQHVQRAKVDVAGCDGEIVWQLALNAEHSLQRVRRLQSLLEPVNRARN